MGNALMRNIAAQGLYRPSMYGYYGNEGRCPPAQYTASQPCAAHGPRTMPALNEYATQGSAALVAAARTVQADALQDIFGILENVAADATEDATASPQRPMIVNRLIVVEATAGDFTVNSIQIGVENVFASATGIPAAVFRTDGTGPSFRTQQIVFPGTDVTVNVTNNDAMNALDFQGAFYGLVPAGIGC